MLSIQLRDEGAALGMAAMLRLYLCLPWPGLKKTSGTCPSTCLLALCISPRRSGKGTEMICLGRTKNDGGMFRALHWACT